MKEVNELIPEKSYVKFAGSFYKVAEITDRLGVPFIGIYDEPPSDHIDYIQYSSCEDFKEPFIKPTDKQLVEIAILFNDGKLQRKKLSDMVAMAEFIINRLYENGDVLIKSSIEES